MRKNRIEREIDKANDIDFDYKEISDKINFDKYSESAREKKKRGVKKRSFIAVMSGAMAAVIALSIALPIAFNAKNVIEKNTAETPVYNGTDAVAPIGEHDAAFDAVGAPSRADGFYGETVDKTAEVGNGRERIPAGLITASEWDDNGNYQYFLSLFSEKVEQIEPDENGQQADIGEVVRGKFQDYLEKDRWGFYANDRVIVRVTDEDGAPVVGAKVAYYNGEQNTVCAVSDALGTAYIFPESESGSFIVKSGDNEVIGSYSAEERDVTVTLSDAAEKDNIIKLMFVVDVTGSMGDELRYLTAEVQDVISRVASANDGVRIDLALLFYRDDGDIEKFAYHDFVTVTDNDQGLSEVLANMKKQSAEGGGDYPEALDEALEIAAEKDWGSENSTKIIFHLYDAPPHEEQVNKSRYASAVMLAAEKGIRINPVLCSGADLLCEYLARECAIHTQGRFVFVTDDSGIGGSHHDPEIPDAVVEALNDLLVRLVNGFHSGVFAEPVKWQAPQEEQ